MRLSIIVPVYNVEQWLNRCLDSLYKQELSEEEFEVILVNDGSTDSSLSMAEIFASHHSNVRIINRENGGLSVARNTGLEYAQGCYIWFVDSDDFIEPKSIKPILEYAENNKLDMMCFLFQFKFDDEHTEQYIYRPKYKNEIMTGEEFVVKTGFVMSPWASLYRRQFLSDNSLRFKEGILHEDEEFSPRAQFLAQRIAHTDAIVYNYFQRTGSIMKSSRSELRVSSFLAICDSCYTFMKSRVNPESEAYEFFKRRLLFCFSQGLSHLSKCESRDLQQFKSKPYYPLEVPNNLPLKLKIKLFLINHFTLIYVTGYRIKGFSNSKKIKL